MQKKKMAYVVRKTWEDAASQIGGEFTDFGKLVMTCPIGYTIYDTEGREVLAMTEKDMPEYRDAIVLVWKDLLYELDFTKIPLIRQVISDLEQDAAEILKACLELETGECRPEDVIEVLDRYMETRASLGNHEMDIIKYGATYLALPVAVLKAILTFRKADFREVEEIFPIQGMVYHVLKVLQCEDKRLRVWEEYQWLDSEQTFIPDKDDGNDYDGDMDYVRKYRDDEKIVQEQGYCLLQMVDFHDHAIKEILEISGIHYRKESKRVADSLRSQGVTVVPRK